MESQLNKTWAASSDQAEQIVAALQDISRGRPLPMVIGGTALGFTGAILAYLGLQTQQWHSENLSALMSLISGRVTFGQYQTFLFSTAGATGISALRLWWSGLSGWINNRFQTVTPVSTKSTVTVVPAPPADVNCQPWIDYAENLESHLGNCTLELSEIKARDSELTEFAEKTLLSRRLLLRALIMVPFFAVASLIATLLCPLTELPSNGQTADVIATLQSERNQHGLAVLCVTFVAALGSALILGGKKLIRCRWYDLAMMAGLAAFMANLAYMLISQGYPQFWSGRGDSSLLHGLMVYGFRLIACPISAAIGCWLGVLLRKAGDS